MTRLATASALQSLIHCIAPLGPDIPEEPETRSWAARGGTASHSMFELETLAQKDSARAIEYRLKMSVAAADNGLTDRQMQICRSQLEVWKRWAIAHGGVDQAWWPEPAFAYNPETTEAFIGLPKKHRDYTWVPEGWIAGTADLVIVRPQQSLYVSDYKCGRSWVDGPQEGNRQILGLAVMASKAFGVEAAGVDKVRAGIVRFAENDYYESAADIDVFDLAETEEELRRMGRRIKAQDFAPVVGDHCHKCRARKVCKPGSELIALRKKESEAT